jgi:hypothetical protein
MLYIGVTSLVMMEDGWRPDKEEMSQSFHCTSLIFMFESNEKHRTVRRDDLDWIDGDVTIDKYTSYHHTTRSQ